MFDIPDWCLIFGDFCGASHDGVDLFWLSLGFLKILIVTPQIGPTIPPVVVP